MAEATDLKLTDEIKALVSGALEAGNPLLLAVVDHLHKPLLSFRGSTVPFSDTQMSFWARDGGGGTIEAIRLNPQVALMYRSATVPLLQFAGSARVTEDEAERERAFSLSSPKEQERDPERAGVAVIVDLDTVNGVLGLGNPVRSSAAWRVRREGRGDSLYRSVVRLSHCSSLSATQSRCLRAVAGPAVH